MPLGSGYGSQRASGAPVDLFLFTYGEGAGDFFAYCNAEEPVVHEGITYEPVPISRSAIKSKGKPTDTDITVTVASDSGLAELFRGFLPRRVILLRIYQGHIARASDYADLAATAGAGLSWTGRVLEASRKAARTELNCDTLGAGMKRPGFSVNYARECQRVLYGNRCAADKVAASSTATVSSSTVSTLTLSAGWDSRGAQNYLGGLVEWIGVYGTETRAVMSVSGDTLTLDGPAPDLAPGDTVTVVLGCPRTLDGCRNLHNNILNYGGTFAIPLENPIGKSQF